MTLQNTYFKSRLNYLGTRFAELDLVNIAYFPVDRINNETLEGDGLLITAQVGRSNNDILLESGSMESSYTRDYFIFAEELVALDSEGQPTLTPYLPQEGDVILDDAYEKFYCRVSTRNSLSTYKPTNETNVRYRIRTSMVQMGDIIQGIPDILASYLRSDAMPISRGVRPQPITIRMGLPLAGGMI